MAKTFAEELASRESRVLIYVRYVMLTVALVYAALATWSMYRRIWQIQRIELSVTSRTLSTGSTIGYDVITSGEVRNLIRLELVQSGNSAVLVELRGQKSAIMTIDPRLFREKGIVVLSSQMLSSFRAGPAVVKLTAFGGQKLLRTPPPRTREVAVTLVR